MFVPFALKEIIELPGPSKPFRNAPLASDPKALAVARMAKARREKSIVDLSNPGLLVAGRARTVIPKNKPKRHREERSDVAIQSHASVLDRFAPRLAITTYGRGARLGRAVAIRPDMAPQRFDKVDSAPGNGCASGASNPQDLATKRAGTIIPQDTRNCHREEGSDVAIQSRASVLARFASLGRKPTGNGVTKA
jgi:hypothetical protein